MKTLRDFVNSLQYTDLREDIIKKYTDAGYFDVDPGLMSEEDWHERKHWIVENISTDHAALAFGHFIFEFEEDVILYKVRWGR